MAVDMFLKIDDVKGESVDAASGGKHKGEIDVLAWSWGMSQSGSTHVGTGGGSGKVNVNDISITKYLDRSSPNLIQFCCNGRHFKEAILTVRKAGGKAGPVEYLTIKMNDIIVSSISSGGSGGEDRLTENVTLNFAKFEVNYTTQKPDGSADAKIPVTWNIAGNAEK